MAQTYTLEQAADRLGMAQDEFKRKIRDEWKSVRSFRDGPTLRYRASDIDELARSLGEASDPGLSLGPVGAGEELTTSVDDSSADHFSFNDDSPTEDAPPEYQPAEPEPAAELTPTAAEEPLIFDADEPDEEPTFDLGDEPSPSDKIAKTGTDSNVKVGPTPGSGRHNPPVNPPSDEIDIDVSGGPRSGVIRPTGSSPKLSAGGISGSNLAGPKSAKFSGPPSGKIPGPTGRGVNPDDGSSEFELNLDADSDSFELKLGNDSDEADMGLDLSPPPQQNRGGLSGINLGKPADSGLSLEGGPGSKAPQGDDEDPDLDFDLSVDSGEVDVSGPRTTTSARNDAQTSSLDSDSEFELTLDDNSGVTDAISDDLLGPRTASSNTDHQNDIFETDFDLPIVSDDGGDAEDSLASDFDLAISESDAPAEDESGSEVVLVDDDMAIIDDDGGVIVEDDDALAEAELEGGASASKALLGVSRDDDDYYEEDESRPVRTVAAAPATWGPLPAIVLLPCLLLAFIGSLTSFELVRGMWGYHQPSAPANVVVSGLADAMGMKVQN